MNVAKLSRYGLLSVTGGDARDFLHAQLTNNIKNLAPGRAALAGWCSAKGRLLASLLVVPTQDGFLLQLARDLAPTVAKRLALFVLRSKVKIADVSDAWTQVGLWGEERQQPSDVFGVAREGDAVFVRMGEKRYLSLVPGQQAVDGNATEEAWALEEIRAGHPLITAATQDQFVPQMVNFVALGGIDFQKGCYPGQEIVARAQYRGQVKRHMVRLPAPAGASLKPGDEFNGGVVVDSAGGEVLAVVPL